VKSAQPQPAIDAGQVQQPQRLLTRAAPRRGPPQDPRVVVDLTIIAMPLESMKVTPERSTTTSGWWCSSSHNMSPISVALPMSISPWSRIAASTAHPFAARRRGRWLLRRCARLLTGTNVADAADHPSRRPRATFARSVVVGTLIPSSTEMLDDARKG